MNAPPVGTGSVGHDQSVSPPATWDVPHMRNPQFTNRDEPPMDNAPAPRGWRNPTIIAAIIAAIAAITVALIALVPKSPSPATKPQQPTINQTTSGPGSPNVGQAGGNVEIKITNEQPGTPKK